MPKLEKAKSLGQRDSNATSSFSEEVRNALEHFNDIEWLGNHSPLAAPYFLGKRLLRQPLDTSPGTRGKVLQTVMRQALENLLIKGEEGRYARAILDMRYLGQKSLDFIADSLNISRATYYRHESKSLALFEETFIRGVNPSLRLEFPHITPNFVGRQIIVAEILTALKQNTTVAVLGKSGVGKTAIGSQLAKLWGTHAVFWFTFQREFNDHPNSLLFSLGCLLSQYGASSLWLQLVADRGQTSLPMATALLGHDLESFKDTQLLLCFDEFDILRPDESEQHAQIVTLLSNLHRSVSILIIGQVPLAQRIFDCDLEFIISDLSQEDTNEMLTTLGLNIDTDTLPAAFACTIGNPRLISLLASLIHSGETVDSALQSMRTSLSIEALVLNIFRRLEATEKMLLKSLCVFPQSSPIETWSFKSLKALDDRGLVVMDQLGGVSVPNTIKTTVLRHMRTEEREKYHTLARHVSESQAQYTMAVYHCILGGQFKEAIALWQLHKQKEIDQGHAAEALSIFDQVSTSQLSGLERETLSIIRGELGVSLGELRRAEDELQSVEWDTDTFNSVLARNMGGEIAVSQNRLAEAAQAFQNSAALAAKLGLLVVHSHWNLSRVMWRKGDYEAAWRETLIAQCELLTSQGFLQVQFCEFETAKNYFERALDLSIKNNIVHVEAEARRGYADLLGYLEEYSAAEQQIRLALLYYETSGDAVRSAFAQGTLAAILSDSGNYTEAEAMAHKSLDTCEFLGVPAGVARAALVLADNYKMLGNLDEAKKYACQAIAVDLDTYTQYGFRTLGDIWAKQGDFAQASDQFRQACAIATKLGDKFVEAHATRRLGESLIAMNQFQEARDALTKAIALFAELSLPAEVAVSQNIVAGISQ